jgi:beta-lactamase regulating signal transducer with metallopeptidase domain
VIDVEILNSAASLWWDWAVRNTLQVSILILLLYFFDIATRRWVWPQLRLALWLVVLGKLILPPSLSSPISVTAPLYSRASQLLDQAVSYSPEASGRVGRSALDRPGSWAVRQDRVPRPPQAQPAKTAGHPEQPVLTPTAIGNVEAAARPSWKTWLLALWAGVTSSLVVLLLLSTLPLRRRVIRCSREARLGELASEAARTAGLASVPAIRISGLVAAPAVVGIIRPVIILPEDFISTSRAEDVRNALLHEMCHIRRLDPTIQRAALLLHALYWFNPLLWLARRRVRHLTELGCDASVVGLLKGETRSYRETLIRALRPLLASSSPGGLDRLGLLERPDRITERLRWLARGAPSRCRLPVIVGVSILVAGIGLPMMTESTVEVGAFTILRVSTFTPVGTSQPLLNHLEVLAGRRSEGTALVFTGLLGDPESSREIRIFPPHTAPIDAEDDCAARIGNPFAREGETLGYRTLVFRRALGDTSGAWGEFHLAPELGCVPLKIVNATGEGIGVTEAVEIHKGEKALAALALLKSPGDPLRTLAERDREDPPADARTAYPGVRAVMIHHLERMQLMPRSSEYQQDLTEVTRSLTQAGAAPDPTGVFDYPFGYQVRAAVGPNDEIYLADAGEEVIHRCARDGSIIESYPIGMRDPSNLFPYFAVDSTGRPHVPLSRERRGPHRPPAWDLVRAFNAPEAYVEVPLSPPVPYPADFAVDSTGRHYFLTEGAPTGIGAPRSNRERPRRSESIARYSAGGDLEQWLSLDFPPEDRSSAEEADWSGPVRMAVLADGRTFLLVLCWGTESGVAILSGELYEVDWSVPTLREVPVVSPGGPLVRLTSVHAAGDALVLEWTDYASVENGRAVPPPLALKKLQLRRWEVTEPMAEVRGRIHALSESTALVTPPWFGGGPPTHYLVTLR